MNPVLCIHGMLTLVIHMVADTETEIKAAQSVVEAAERSYMEQKASAENLRSEYDQILTWADLYDKSSFEAKKMIAAQFIKAVRVGRNCNIEIEFNFTFEEFHSYCIDAEQVEKKAGVCSQPA